jgi:choline-sulfatase
MIRSLLLLLALGVTLIRAEAIKRPNILFILVDDQSPMDLRLYNPASTLETPNLDRLAKRGVVLESAYHMGSSSGAVCVPSRHMIMSGRSVWHLPVSPWASRLSPPQLEQNSIPAVFNRGGYQTMRTCKMGNSYEAANKLFEVRRDATKREGTAEGGSAWHADQVLEYLRGRQQGQSAEKPFLIYFGFSHPHDTRDGTPELLAKYGASNHAQRDQVPSLHSKQPPLPANHLSRHPFDNTDMKVRDEIEVSGVWGRRDEASIRNEIGRQYACSENIDIQIGRVLAQLEAMGELHNTLIFYTSDHGISIGRHGLMGKQNLYEHTWRVPFIAAGPGIAQGKRLPGNIYLMDLLATFCDYAQIKAPETSEGISFRSVLEDRKPALREVIYGAYSGGAKPGMRSIRQGNWKLIEYESMDGANRHSQLFDLAQNPDELLDEHHKGGMQRNLANDPAHAETLKRLRALLLAEMRRLDDPWRFSNQPNDNLPPPPAPAKRKAKAKTRTKDSGQSGSKVQT